MPVSNMFEILDSVDSTNNYAMGKVYAGLAKHGAACFAYRQTGGKGQRGRQWQTGDGANIAMSIVVEPKQWPLTRQFSLSVAVALACYDFFHYYAGEDTAIKWPNDLYWRDRKAGGVLIENVVGNSTTGNNWKFAVVGIGININQAVFDPVLKNPVSLKQITGKEFDVIELARSLRQLVLTRIEEAVKGGEQTQLELYNSRLFCLNKPVRMRKGSIDFNTVIRGVQQDGRLYTTDTIDNYFDFGEVEWLLD